MRDIYYPREFIEGLVGDMLPVPTDRVLVAYYWLVGRDLHYWAPQCTGVMSAVYASKPPASYSCYLCEKLNDATKYLYSLNEYTREDDTVTPIIKPHCLVVGDRCLVRNNKGMGCPCFLPLQAVGVLHLPVEREVPVDAIWEVVMMYSLDKLCTHLQLQGTNYALCMDSDHGYAPGDAREVVYVGTLDQCLFLNGYLKEAYRRGRMSAVGYVGKLCSDGSV